MDSPYWYMDQEKKRKEKAMQEPKIIKQASNHPAASTGERALFDIFEALRKLDREDIRYRFDPEELAEAIKYLLFYEELNY